MPSSAKPDSKVKSTTEQTSLQVRRLRRELAQVKRNLAEYRLGSEALVNSIGEGLIALDEHGFITAVNPYAAQALRTSAESLIGKWFTGALVATDKYGKPLDPLTRPMLRALTTGQAVSDYIHYLRADGSLLPLFVTASPVLIEGKPVGAIEVFRDLTEEQQLDIAKDEFVSLASHQLRTPATGVASILSMLHAGDFGPLTPMQHKFLTKAIAANRRQLLIIEDMLNVARIDAGRMEYEPAEADLAALVREVAADHQETIATRSQKLELTLPVRCVMGFDAEKIRMVVDNLISNASKYSKAGAHITVVLSCDTHVVTLEVTDTGIGIPAGEVANLFQKFSRVDNELSLEVGGSGLGLFLAKNIVELHGGAIAAASREGKGSTFTVTLPATEVRL